MSDIASRPWLLAETPYGDDDTAAIELSEDEFAAIALHQEQVAHWLETSEPDAGSRAAEPAAAVAFDLVVEIYEQREGANLTRSELELIRSGRVERVVGFIFL